jgi:cyclin A
VRPLADDVGMPRLRLLGAVAVYAADKYEDQGTVEVLDAFVEHFTRHYGQEEARLELRSCAHDFADMSLLHYGCLQHKPSAVAAAAMLLARLTLKPTYGQMRCWNRELKELTGYGTHKIGALRRSNTHSLIPMFSYDDVELFPMFYAIADQQSRNSRTLLVLREMHGQRF